MAINSCYLQSSQKVISFGQKKKKKILVLNEKKMIEVPTIFTLSCPIALECQCCSNSSKLHIIGKNFLMLNMTLVKIIEWPFALISWIKFNQLTMCYSFCSPPKSESLTCSTSDWEDASPLRLKYSRFSSDFVATCILCTHEFAFFNKLHHLNELAIIPL